MIFRSTHVLMYWVLEAKWQFAADRHDRACTVHKCLKLRRGLSNMGWGGGWGGKGKFGGGGGGWSPWQPMFMKWGKGKGKGSGLKVDPALKCWIGNLAEGTSWKALQDHMNQAGKTTWVECFSGKGSGTGGVSFSTAEEAANAITMLNGSLLNGQAIMVDVWVKQSQG
ncbi:srp2 [Symbiodinium sp. CCMP2456]|nr:srp2 [Symbiodinium sp. CCMP2456]